MNIEFKKTTIADFVDLVALDIDEMDYTSVEAVMVENQLVGFFVTTDEGWGCEYMDKANGQTIDFGEADYDVAKKRLVKMIKAFN